MDGLKQRAKTIKELTENAAFYFRSRPLEIDDKAARLLAGDGGALLDRLSRRLAALAEWSEAAVESAVRSFAEDEGMKLGAVAQPLRSALTGTTTSPGIFEVAAILGRDEVLGRVEDAVRR